VNAVPIFADIERDTYGLDHVDVQQKLNTKTRAIIPVHYGGTACDIFNLQKVAEDNNILLIEDAAESIGSKVEGKKVGSIGNSSIVSFCGNKVMTTGEGGAVLTDSKEIYERLKLVRSHGRNEIQNYFSTSEPPDYVQLGYNWRISSMTAAIGLSQLRKLERLIDLRRRNSGILSDRLSKFSWIRTPREIGDRFNVYQMYTIEVQSHDIREKLRQHLSQRGITCKVYFDPVHESKFYANLIRKRQSLPVTEEISRRVLSLPMYPTLSNEEIEYIVGSISEFSELYMLQN
jgi:perosamine synthetase